MNNQKTSSSSTLLSWGVLFTALLFWLALSWFVTGHFMASHINALIQEKTADVDLSATTVAEDIALNFNGLYGISTVVARDRDVLNALSRFGATPHPSSLAVEQRKQIWSEDAQLKTVDGFLNLAGTSLGGSVVYIMNAAGDCVAASNAGKADSFVGANFASREYFREAVAGKNGYQYAMGKVSNLPGLYFSVPATLEGRIVGVAAAKINLSALLHHANQMNVLITDEYGVIILASDAKLEMRSLPGATIATLSKAERMARYKREDFPALSINPWPGQWSATLRHFNEENQPILLAERRQVKEGINILAFKRLPQIAEITRDRWIQFSLLGIFGTLLLLLATWRINALRIRAQNDKQLHRSETQFRTLFDSNSDAVMLLDDKGFFDCNKATLAMFGCATKEEFCSKHPADLSPPEQPCGTDSMTLANRQVATAMEMGSNLFEWVHKRLDTGDTFPANVLLTRMELDERKVLQATVRDITLRKAAQQALQDSQENMHGMLNSMAEGVYGVDGEGNFTFVNTAFLHILGYPDDSEIIGKHAHELIHHSRADGKNYPVKECQVYLAYQSGQATHADDEVFWRKDGTCVAVEYWSHPIVKNGKLAGAVATFLDITERIARNTKLLTLSEAVENSPASIVITDPDGTIEYVNRRFTEVTGYTAQEAIGQNPRILKTGTYAPKFYENLWQTILAGEIWRGEFHNKKKSGEGYFEAASISPILDSNGNIAHFVAVKEDVTERKHILQELKNSKAAAEAASLAKGDFLANMSHEIRTPMNAIIGLSHLCMQTELTPKQSDYLHKVHGAANSLLGIINDILDFSKIEAGKMDVEHVSFELRNVMDNLATIVTTKAEEKGLEFLFEMSMDVPSHLIGDPLRLGQVLINLAGNAVKFTGKGEVLVLTEVEEKTAEHVVLRFTVRDSGIGMTQEQIGKLFQAFTQADSTTTRKFGGTGLGLSISKQLVGLMHGEIWAESAPGKGSEFIFTARFGNAAERRSGERHMPNVDLRGMRVLAVDDNATSLHILQSYLESFAFKVTTTNSSLGALQAIEQAEREGMPYRFVVLDWKMPGMDGIEAARNIHTLAGLSQMPKILLISSFGQSEMLRHLEGNVVDGMLAKPFHQSELLDATMEIFGRAEAKGKRNAATALFHPDMVAKISGAYILLVEDNEINQMVARELLEKAGVSVTIAENGEEAIAWLLKDKFDGVLMDMQMPVMDGISATREIRKNPEFARLPIIAMTANAMASDREKCRAAGMNDYIVKPIDPNQMVATLAKWITPAQPVAAPNTPDLKTKQRPETVQGSEVVQSAETLLDLPGVNVAEGVRRMGDNVAGYCVILERFRSGRQNTLAEIHSAIAADDWEKAERLAHTLRGLLGTIGAEKLMARCAELETAIRDKMNGRIHLLHLVIDTELTQLFAAIDRALQLREAEVTPEVADSITPINMDKLADLIRQLKLQLEQFDSSVEDTVAMIRRMVDDDAALKKTMASIERHISGYAYEQGLAELTACARSMDVLREG